jgi:hypothetical protein
MFADEIKKLCDEYYKWLKNKSQIATTNYDDVIQITTSFLDRHNDYIELYAIKQKDGTIKLSDGGFTLSDLESSGFSFSPKRKDLLKFMLCSENIQKENEELFIITDINSFNIAKNNLIQTILNVNDLFYLSSPHVESLFIEQFNEWLDNNNVSYSPNIKIAGFSGFDHNIKYIIPKSEKYPERILEVLSNPTKESVGNIAFKWNDIKKNRQGNSICITYLNDDNISSVAYASQITNALKNYNIEPIMFSNADEKIELLTT